MRAAEKRSVLRCCTCNRYNKTYVSTSVPRIRKKVPALRLTFDRLLHIHEAVPDGLQELVEPAHLLNQDRVHALLVQRGILLQSIQQVIVQRQNGQHAGSDAVHDLVRRFLGVDLHLAGVLGEKNRDMFSGI